MDTFINCLIVGAGGMLGTVARYLLGLLPIKAQNSFPIITLVINLVGAFCIGLIVALSERSASANPQTLLFLKVGLCGGFTTFSTFSLEAVQLLQSGKWGIAVTYMVLSVVLCVAAIVGARRLVI